MRISLTLILMVAGGIVIVLSAASEVLKAQADLPPQVFSGVEIAQSGPPTREHAEQFENLLWEGINLTSAQQSRISQIRRQTRSRLERVLTSEQRQLLSNQGQSSSGFGRVRELNLSDAQRAELRATMQSEQQQIEAVLTPEQRQQLAQNRQKLPSISPPQ